MPSRQRGGARKRGNSWTARYYDESGVEREKGGFRTRTDALAYLHDRLDEVEAVRRGDVLPARDRPKTIDHLLDVFLTKHGRTVDPATLRKLTSQLRQAREEFGHRDPSSLFQLEIEDWRHTLSPGSRAGVTTAFKQALQWGHDRGLVDRNPAARVRNPERPRRDRKPIIPFENWQEVEEVATGLDPAYQTVPVFATGTGLRPEEWLALHRTDIDRANGVVHVRRRFTGGHLKNGLKRPDEAERDVPLRRRVLRALDAMTPRIDTPILFPADDGDYMNLEHFRRYQWDVALRAVGLPHRGPNAMRHTFCTWAIEAKGDEQIPLPKLALIMGTSLREIENTYHRWLHRSDDQIRAALDAYDEREASGG